MPVLDDLRQIRSAWISKISNRLARGESLRASLRDELEQFYGRLIQSVESGNPAWINPVIAEWVQARTTSELEENRSSLGPVIDQLLYLSYETANENLDSAAALDLIGAVLPIYSHAFDYAANLEIDLRIDHITAELEKARDVLERLDKSKSDFISIAAHELKTPLTLIGATLQCWRSRLNKVQFKRIPC
jgi:signal transduction histidine kinase